MIIFIKKKIRSQLPHSVHDGSCPATMHCEATQPRAQGESLRKAARSWPHPSARTAVQISKGWHRVETLRDPGRAQPGRTVSRGGTGTTLGSRCSSFELPSSREEEDSGCYCTLPPGQHRMEPFGFCADGRSCLAAACPNSGDMENRWGSSRAALHTTGPRGTRPGSTGVGGGRLGWRGREEGAGTGSACSQCSVGEGAGRR